MEHREIPQLRVRACVRRARERERERAIEISGAI